MTRVSRRLTGASSSRREVKRGTESRDALSALCEAYWYPLYAFVRRKGYDAENAQDLVQGFLARLLEKRDLLSVEPEKGRFRSFLMAACGNYMSNQRDHERAKKRGGARVPISIDRLTAEGRYCREPAHDMTAERLFERQWALTLLDRVVDQLESEMGRAGKATEFLTLKPALFGGAARVPYSEIAAALGISADAARAAAHRLRGRFRSVLRAEVARTLVETSDIEEEIAALFAALGS